MADRGRRTLDQAHEGLEKETPDRVARAIRRLRDPKSRWIRIPLGVLPIAGSMLWFLPVLGIGMPPFGIGMPPPGLLLIAQDVPFLREPVGRAMIRLEREWAGLRRRWKGG
jgi:hypothetical protein